MGSRSGKANNLALTFLTKDVGGQLCHSNAAPLTSTIIPAMSIPPGDVAPAPAHGAIIKHDLAECATPPAAADSCTHHLGSYVIFAVAAEVVGAGGARG